MTGPRTDTARLTPDERYETLTGLLDAYRTPVTIILFGLIVSLSLFFATLVNQSRAQEREFRRAANVVSREFAGALERMAMQLDEYTRALDAGLSLPDVESAFAGPGLQTRPQPGYVAYDIPSAVLDSTNPDHVADDVAQALYSSMTGDRLNTDNRLVALPDDTQSGLRFALVRDRSPSTPARVFIAAHVESLLPPDRVNSPILWVIASIPGHEPAIALTRPAGEEARELPDISSLLNASPFRLQWSAPGAFEGLELILVPRRSFLLRVGPLPWLVLAFSLFATMTLGALSLKDARRAVDIRMEVRRKTVELERSKAIIEAKNLDLARFAAHASHDLQAPLRTMQGMSSILMNRHAEMDDHSQDMLNRINRGAERAQRLVQDLLTYTQADTAQINPEPVTAEELALEIEELLEAPLQESGGQLVWDFDAPVIADRFLLTRALQNLVSNGLKYRSEAPPLVRITANRSARGSTLCVEDNGIGIDPTHFTRIFEVFERLHGQAEIEGSGIGLALCRRVADLHQGRIWLESEPGQGSRFYLFIPEPPADTLEQPQRRASNDR